MIDAIEPSQSIKINVQAIEATNAASRHTNQRPLTTIDISPCVVKPARSQRTFLLATRKLRNASSINAAFSSSIVLSTLKSLQRLREHLSKFWRWCPHGPEPRPLD